MIRTTCSRQNRFNPASQRGMGATVVLFTIALIVLVGAALAFASRGSPSAVTTQSAKLQAALLLKQSAEYRDAYSRFVSDGLNVANMVFTQTPVDANDLLWPASQYATYQAPPAAAMAAGSGGTWVYNKAVELPGIGTSGSNNDSVVYVDDVAKAVCEQVTLQMYGTTTVDTIATGFVLTAAGPWGVASARSSGCFRNGTAGNYVFYSTLGEG